MRRLAALLLLVLACACDGSEPGSAPVEACTPLAFDCTTLPGMSQQAGVIFSPQSALEADSLLFVATTLRTAERAAGDDFAEEETVVLVKRLAEPDPDRGWRAFNVSRSPDALDGTGEGTPVLFRTGAGQVGVLWGEVERPLGGLRSDFDLVALRYSLFDPRGGLREAAWTEAEAAYAPPCPKPGQGAGALTPSALTLASGEVLVTFVGESDDYYGNVMQMRFDGSAGASGAWSAAEAVPGAREVWNQSAAVLADGTVLLVWLDLSLRTPGEQRLGGIQSARSVDGGRTWTEPVVVMTGGAHQALYPQAGQFSSGEAIVFYARDVDLEDPFADQFWVSRSPDGGASWQPPEALGGSGRDVFDLALVPRPAGGVDAFAVATPSLGGGDDRLIHIRLDSDIREDQTGVAADALTSPTVASSAEGGIHTVWSHQALVPLSEYRRDEVESFLRYALFVP